MHSIYWVSTTYCTFHVLNIIIKNKECAIVTLDISQTRPTFNANQTTFSIIKYPTLHSK